MANPYKHPDTGKMMKKAAYLALMAERNGESPRRAAASPETPLRSHEKDDGGFIAELSPEEHAELLERRRRADPFNQLPRAMTDEGRAQIEAEKRAKGLISDGPRVEVTRDAHDNVMDKRIAATSGKLPEWEFPEVEREILEKYAEPGYRHRLLSPTHITKRGMRRFETVKDENGDVVKFGRMVLGRMPEPLAQARDRAIRTRSAEQMGSVVAGQVDALKAVEDRDPSAGVRALAPGTRVKGDTVGMQDIARE